MEADKSNDGKKRLAVILGISFALFLVLVLVLYELWVHSHPQGILAKK
jgi:hypothetical protein